MSISYESQLVIVGLFYGFMLGVFSGYAVFWLTKNERKDLHIG
jgi:hypothetical protein